MARSPARAGRVVPLSARALALEVLGRIERDGAYANLVLPATLNRSDLGAADRGMVTDLVYGTTRMRRACDLLVDRFVEVPPDDSTRTLLRLGAYQLVFGGVAAHAAVSETVALAPRRTRGFVNAVLRRVASIEMTWPSEAARLSYPDWIHDLLVDELGDVDAAEALERMNVAPTVNRRADGYVQDPASQWVAASVEARRGELIADLCSAPGGKTTAMAATGADVVALDLHPARAGLVADNAAATAAEGVGRVYPLAADSCRPPLPEGVFDAVLIDAPCSGLGALRRRPDARWRVTPQTIRDLVPVQADLLAAGARLLRPGGRLIYSVCTLTAAESISHRTPEGLEIDPAQPVGLWRPFGDGWRVLPHDADTDGMVMLRYRRRP